VTPSIRSLLHVAIDAGLVTDVSITLPDREAIDRQLATLKEQGWEVSRDPAPLRAECCDGAVEFWYASAEKWDGERSTHIRFQSPAVSVEVAA
jgi:hypothetical protein